jgi:hypothetical protein
VQAVAVFAAEAARGLLVEAGGAQGVAAAAIGDAEALEAGRLLGLLHVTYLDGEWKPLPPQSIATDARPRNGLRALNRTAEGC